MIGIVVIATNQYLPLGVRFIKRFSHFYKGTGEILFFLFSNEPVQELLPESIRHVRYEQVHTSWQDGTNSKFSNILKCIWEYKDVLSHIFYFDADTNINVDFEDWFVKDGLVGGEHFGNRSFLSGGKGFDRNPKSHCYVPESSNLQYTYHYGAFFGGSVDEVGAMCEDLMMRQDIDHSVGYEAPVNDESYINYYFHFNPPHTIPTEQFKFMVSDKGGLDKSLGGMRVAKAASIPIAQLQELKYDLFNIENGKITSIKKDIFK